MADSRRPGLQLEKAADSIATLRAFSRIPHLDALPRLWWPHRYDKAVEVPGFASFEAGLIAAGYEDVRTPEAWRVMPHVIEASVHKFALARGGRGPSIADFQPANGLPCWPVARQFHINARTWWAAAKINKPNVVYFETQADAVRVILDMTMEGAFVAAAKRLTPGPDEWALPGNKHFLPQYLDNRRPDWDNLKAVGIRDIYALRCAVIAMAEADDANRADGRIRTESVGGGFLQLVTASEADGFKTLRSQTSTPFER